MAEIYVRSTDGNDADNGSTWALAKATLAGAAAIDAAGDTIYVSQAHAENSASAQTIALASTNASPVKIICANDGAEPPTAAATSGTVTTTGASSITFTGGGYLYGLSFSAGSGASNASIVFNTANKSLLAASCNFTLGTSSSSAAFSIGAANDSNPHLVELENCSFTFGANTGQVVSLSTAKALIRGGSFNRSTFTGPLFGITSASGEGCLLEADGCDLSNLSSTVTLFSVATTTSCVATGVLRNCRLPASWTGSLCSATPQPGHRFEMWNCDSADTNYRIWIEASAGSIKHSTAVKKDSWAGSDTAHSLVFAANSSANEPLNRLAGPDFFADNATVGSSVTATVEIVTDGVTLTDAECWLEVMYMGTSGVPLGAWISDHRADLITAAANQTSSSETWTTTGLSSPVKQQLSVTFTPREAGYVIGRVVLAKPSTTVYVDPELKLS